METIKIYDLHNAFKVDAFPKISLPKNAQILKVDSIGNIARLFAVIDTDETENVIRDFCLLPTGADMRSMQHTPVYLGSVQLNNGQLVLHIFELVKESLNGTEHSEESNANDN